MGKTDDVVFNISADLRRLVAEKDEDELGPEVVRAVEAGLVTDELLSRVARDAKTALLDVNPGYRETLVNVLEERVQECLSGPVFVISNISGEVRIPLEDCGVGPGLGEAYVKVIGPDGSEVAPEHRYHFDVRSRTEMDLSRYVEEPEELPDLPAYLVVEPYQI